jgi:RNA polymerase sigma-70 factor, ECF subfamily
MLSRLSLVCDDFCRLVTSELPGLRQHALRLCRDVDAAADLVQDTVERALARRDSFAPGTHLRSWLHTILRNIFTDNWRRSSIRPEQPCDFQLHPPPDPSEPATGRWREVDDTQLRAAMRQLPDPLRTAFELHATEGLSYKALASRLGIKRSTAGTRLMRARRRLLALLTGARPAHAAQPAAIRPRAAIRRRPAARTDSRPPGYAPGAPSTRARPGRCSCAL